MIPIQKQIDVAIGKSETFAKFIDVNSWWPEEYTWSGESLSEIRIDAILEGLCTEIGPYGFRCDWGRVISIKDDEFIELKWQIGMNREPIPDPDKASNLRITFFSNDTTSTKVVLEHSNFENHQHGEEYQSMMDNENGWTYILNKFKEYTERK